MLDVSVPTVPVTAPAHRLALRLGATHSNSSSGTLIGNTMKIHPRPCVAILLVAGTLMTAACSSMKTPATASVAVSTAAVDNAAGAGAAEFAPVEMSAARSKMALANKAMAAKDYKLANDLAMQAQAREIRKMIQRKFGKKVSDKISILYGGSANAANAKTLFSQPDIDGGLIGGASLKADDFATICNAY